MTKKRERKEKKEVDLLVPTNVTEIIGTKDDPCFGKEYDLSTKECKRCGDSELCAICFAQVMHKTRKEVEAENNFKDLETSVDESSIKKYMRGLKRKEEDRKTIISKSMDKFSLDKKTIRTIYKSLN